MQKKFVITALKCDVIARTVFIERHSLCSDLPEAKGSQQSDRRCVVQSRSCCNRNCASVLHHIKKCGNALLCVSFSMIVGMETVSYLVANFPYMEGYVSDNNVSQANGKKHVFIAVRKGSPLRDSARNRLVIQCLCVIK